MMDTEGGAGTFLLLIKNLSKRFNYTHFFYRNLEPSKAASLQHLAREI